MLDFWWSDNVDINLLAKVNKIALERIWEKWEAECVYKKKARSKWTLNLSLFILAMLQPLAAQADTRIDGPSATVRSRNSLA